MTATATWTPAANIVSQPYKIERDGAPAGSGEFSATATSFSFSANAPGSWVFFARSKDAQGLESDWVASNPATVGGTGPAPPSTPTLTLMP